MNGKLFRALAAYLLVNCVCVVAFAQSSATAERLRKDVTYLASDELAGRRTGSNGANKAAQYIAAEFKRYHLRTVIVGSNKQTSTAYQQKFPYIAGVQLGKGNSIISQLSSNDEHALTVQPGDEWMPLGFSQNGSVENPEARFVGYGITATELKHDDYANGVARNKLAIALSGTPDGDNPHGQFAQYEDVRWKAIAARNAGAKALVVIAREPNFKDDRLSQLRYDNSAGDAGIMVFGISQAAAVRLFGIGKMSYLTDLATNTGNSAVSDRVVVDKNIPQQAFFNCFKKITIDIERNEVAASNVIGILYGSDQQLKNEAIVIGAHYDHLGNGGEGSLAPRSGEIHHGADDNASGTAGLLELARTFSTQNPKPKRTLIFIAFSGEEEGLLGSNYYVNHPIFPLASTIAMINMDMIGRMKNNKLIIGGVGTAQEWRDQVARANANGQPVSLAELTSSSRPSGKSSAVNGLDGHSASAIMPAQQFDLTLTEDGYGPSDHSSFYAKRIPVLFFWTGTHDDYHKPSDTADKINYADESRVVGMVAHLIGDVEKSGKRPTYAVAKSDSTGRASGFRVYLGTIPNYADASDGLLLDGVRDDSPAAKAGLKSGDKIVKLAGRDIRNVYDYTYALGEMKAGQEYELEIVRAGERIRLKITPATRK